MADGLIINAHELRGLELAKYVLLRLIDGKTIEDIVTHVAENFEKVGFRNRGVSFNLLL
jgi:hypothetical protein